MALAVDDYTCQHIGAMVTKGLEGHRINLVLRTESAQVLATMDERVPEQLALHIVKLWNERADELRAKRYADVTGGSDAEQEASD